MEGGGAGWGTREKVVKKSFQTKFNTRTPAWTHAQSPFPAFSFGRVGSVSILHTSGRSGCLVMKTWTGADRAPLLLHKWTTNFCSGSSGRKLAATGSKARNRNKITRNVFDANFFFQTNEMQAYESIALTEFVLAHVFPEVNAVRDQPRT